MPVAPFGHRIVLCCYERMKGDANVRHVEEISQGIYRLNAAAALFGASTRELPAAVPPWPGQEAAPAYGWVMGGLRAPHQGDHYLVEFVGKSSFRLIAYVDRFGRVFSTGTPLESPPARKPDLAFARYEEQPEQGVERGCVDVRTPEGRELTVAEYRCAHNRYTFVDTWYDFGPHGHDLTYDDALARAYFAFVHRPALCGVPVPESGLGTVSSRLQTNHPLAALRDVVADVRRAEEDPVLRPPDLVRCLAHWLAEADLDGAIKREGAESEELRLVRTTRYADTYYVGTEDDCKLSARAVWQLEAALNRFLLVGEALGDAASRAGVADCARWDAYLIESVALQAADAAHPADAAQGRAAGEWELRCELGRALENVRAPFRFEADFTVERAAGTVSFEVTAPDAAMMPAWRWADEAGSWVAASQAEREGAALRYALHLGILFAAAAFHHAAAVSRVEVVARPFSDGEEEARTDGGGPEYAVPTRPPAFYRATFHRGQFCEGDAYRAAAAGDPVAFATWCGAVFGERETASTLPARGHQGEPEIGNRPLAPAAASVLGAATTRELRVSFDADRRRTAEVLADRIAAAGTAAASIACVRDVQEAHAGDDAVLAACTRLMTALAEGALDTEDQNAVVGCFLGEDRCLAALGRARTLVDRDPDEAVALLAAAVAEAEADGRYADNGERVFRVFDSYGSRLVYNRLRQGGSGAGEGDDAASGSGARGACGAFSAIAADRGKRVELAPDSLYFCCLEIVKLLEHSFDRTDEALRYGARAMELGPTMAAAYRQTARTYMLVGDFDNAVATLTSCLSIATQPPDIGIAYYQLAYVEWKSGRIEPAVACYLKALMTTSVIAQPATVELQELMGESGAALIPRDEVDQVLERFGIPVAPSEGLLDTFDAAAAAAVDDGLYPVARNLLALRLHYRPDDALVNVLRSLEA